MSLQVKLQSQTWPRCCLRVSCCFLGCLCVLASLLYVSLTSSGCAVFVVYYVRALGLGLKLLKCLGLRVEGWPGFLSRMSLESRSFNRNPKALNPNPKPKS